MSADIRRAVAATTPGACLLSTGGTLRTFRLAVAATGEFTNAKGTPSNTADGGFAGVVQYVNRQVAVFRKELIVRFMLARNGSVMYADPATDPFLTPTANDGSEAVTMPALTTPTTTARIKVLASNNIFFDISNVDFSITAPLNSASTGTIS